MPPAEYKGSVFSAPQPRTRAELEPARQSVSLAAISIAATRARKAARRDPNSFRTRVAARRRDVLREEYYSRGRISRAAYEAGREFEAIYGGHIGPRSPSAFPSNTKCDASVKNEQATSILIAMEKRKRLEKRFVDAIGIADVGFLVEILIKGTGFGKYAAVRGDQRERAVAAVASRFRTVLQHLSERLHNPSSAQRDPTRKDRAAA